MTMPAARLGDQCTGHSCFPPRPNVQASPDVRVNGRGWHRVGDAWAVHCCGLSCHGSALASGSQSVRANGIFVGRITDPVACGSAVMTGSEDVRSS